jgi:hypothetical protein
MPMTFMTFLKQFVNDDSAIGDLARDARDDTRINNRWGFNKFMEHLVIMGACEGARLAALDALDRYSRRITT